MPDVEHELSYIEFYGLICFALCIIYLYYLFVCIILLKMGVLG